jgi:LysM repeat protein
MNETDVYSANTFLNCTDIWVNTPICIPAISYPPTSTVSVAPACGSTYWSVAGDTCQSIAAQFGYYDYQISGANSFLNCNDIWANTPICLPKTFGTPTVTGLPVSSCAATYTSVRGDTCDSIGTKYGITGNEIHNANTFLDCSNIWTYTPICIPAVVIFDPSPTNPTIISTRVEPVTWDPPTMTLIPSSTLAELATQMPTVAVA